MALTLMDCGATAAAGHWLLLLGDGNACVEAVLVDERTGRGLKRLIDRFADAEPAHGAGGVPGDEG